MRTHAAWYLKGLPNSANIKNQLYKITKSSEFIDVIKDYMSSLV